MTGWNGMERMTNLWWVIFARAQALSRLSSRTRRLNKKCSSLTFRFWLISGPRGAGRAA